MKFYQDRTAKREKLRKCEREMEIGKLAKTQRKRARTQGKIKLKFIVNKKNKFNRWFFSSFLLASCLFVIVYMRRYLAAANVPIKTAITLSTQQTTEKYKKNVRIKKIFENVSRILITICVCVLCFFLWCSNFNMLDYYT